MFKEALRLKPLPGLLATGVCVSHAERAQALYPRRHILLGRGNLLHPATANLEP